MKPHDRSRPAGPRSGRVPAARAGPAAFDTLLDRGIELFNRRQFFEAHEVWEDAWRVSSGDRALFLQGLIQIAAGFVKWQRGQPRGMAALLAKGAEKLERLGTQFEGVAVDRLVAAVSGSHGTDSRTAAAQSDPGIPGDPPRIIRQA